MRIRPPVTSSVLVLTLGLFTLLLPGTPGTRSERKAHGQREGRSRLS